MKTQRDILKGIPIDWYHFRPLLNLAGQSLLTMPDCVSLVRYRTCYGIVSIFHSGTRLTGCQTKRHSDISIYMCMAIEWTCSIDMDMQHGHGHAVWTWTMDMQQGHWHAARIWTMDIYRYRNADNKLSMASLVFRYFTTLSSASACRHRGQSGTASHRLVR
jgi:hypothetical protein